MMSAGASVAMRHDHRLGPLASCGRFLLALCILGCWPGKVAGAGVAVFSSGDPATPEVPCFRIPSALALPNTTVVLAFAECRSWTGDGCYIKGRANSSGAQYFNRTICSRRSTDGGASWGAAATKLFSPHVFAANPSAAWDPVRQRVVLVFDNTQDGGIMLSMSSDLGVSFSDPVPARLANQSHIIAFAGPGNNVLVLPTGVIVFAGYAHWRNYSTQQPTFWSNVYLSLDGGVSWSQDGPTFLHLGEPSLALLQGGEIILDARCPDGRHPYGGPPAPCDCNCRGTAVRSANGTWGAMSYNPDIPDPDVAGAVLGLPNGSFAFTNPSSRSRRENMTLHIGRRVSNGIVWDRGRPLSSSPVVPAGYSSIFQAVDTHHIGVLWETHGDETFPNCHGGYCQIVLTMV